MAASTPSSTPLVGREREQAVLWERLYAAMQGQGSLAFIGGEAGIGKTALAETVCAEATEQGALVLVGRCYDLTETPPYGPWVELFDRYEPRDGLPSLPDAFARRGTVGDVASSAALVRQVMDFFATLAASRPLVLLLDDLHWSDPASLDLLRFVARMLRDAPILLMATYRANELTRHHPLYALLPLLVRESQAARLHLHPLDADAIQSLIAVRYALAPDDMARLVTYLDGRAEGNPLFASELLRTLEESRILRRDADGWLLGDLSHTPVPTLLKQVIEGRVARLGENVQALLEIAAVIGQEIPLPLWAAIAEAAEESLLTAVEPARAGALMAETPDGAVMRFAHALIREALYEGIPPAQRRRWHRWIGEILAASPNPDPDAVAWHFRQAGDERAVEWLIAAGERARLAYALIDAADRYEAAIALHEKRGGDVAERGWLLHLLSFVLRFAAPRRGITYSDKALHIAAATGNRPLAAMALSQHGMLHTFCGDYGRGLPDIVAGVALTDALSGDEFAEWARRGAYRLTKPVPVHGSLVIHYTLAGHFRESLAVGERYVSELEKAVVAPNFHDASAHFGLAQTYTRLGRVADAERMSAKALTMYRAMQHHYLHAMCAFRDLRWIQLIYRADRIVERQQMAQEAETALKKADNAGGASVPRIARAPLSFVEGRWDEVRSDALAVLAETDVRTPWRDNAMAMLSLLARAQGDTTLARSLILEALPDGPQTPPGKSFFITDMEMQRLAIILEIEAGNREAAHIWLEAHEHWLAWSGSLLDQAEAKMLWAAYHRAGGDPGQAWAHAREALAHAMEPQQPLTLVVAHRLLAELATESGQFAEVDHHLEASLALADACAAPYERALTLLATAASRAATGAMEATRTLLDEARAICTPLNARPALARADALATRLAATRPRAHGYPAGLSTREVEVLRLVAAGKTNREIADALFLSLPTVNNHVAHILTKTDAANRAEATAFALRHGLV